MADDPFREDLVYLMGGERRQMEVADFPRHKKRMYRSRTNVDIVDLANIRRFTPQLSSSHTVAFAGKSGRYGGTMQNR